MTTDTMTATARKPLCLPCLRCGEEGCVLYLDINAVEDEGADVFKCGACEGEWSLTEARRAVRRWRAVLAWVDSLPDLGGE